MKKRIAVVDDERDIAELAALHLRKANFAVREYHDAASFTASLRGETPHAIILDLMLPDADGNEICRALKADSKHAHIPVIMLTAKGEEADKVLGLELGADDYVTKPFSPRELVARVKAVLRRTMSQQEISKVVRLGEAVVVDSNAYQITVNGKAIDATTTEFRILHLLCQRPGWVYSREKILNHLWGTEKAVIDRTVDVHIKNLREKMGKAGELIKNVRGVGYKVEA
jgi:two-component system phosphate regulon response regulator PhoB/two-component system alkaline phosphatase synthesis response regulator PhoP